MVWFRVQAGASQVMGEGYGGGPRKLKEYAEGLRFGCGPVEMAEVGQGNCQN